MSGVVPTTADTATFTNAITGTIGTSADPISIDLGRTITGITYTGSAGSYVIGSTASNTLTLSTGGAIQILAGVTGSSLTESVNAPLVIGSGAAAASYTFSNASATASNVLDLGGQIGSGTSGTTTLSFAGANTGLNTVSGAIVNGAGTTALSKSGAGSWTLSGANTYTGATSVSQGTLFLTGTLSGGTAISLTGGNLSESSTGVISGGSTLTVNNASSVATLAGANTYTGTTNLTAGALNVNSAGALGGTAALNFNVASAGSFTLDNTSGSAVTLSNNPAIAFANNITLNFTGSSNLNLGSGAISQVGGLTINIGAGRTLTMGGVFTNTQTTGGNPGFSGTAVNGGTLVLGGVALDTVGAGVAGNGQFSGTGNIIINGNVVDGGAANGLFAYKGGTGTLTLNGELLETGNFSQTSGTVILNGQAASARLQLSGGTFLESSTGSITGSPFGLTVSGGSTTLQGVNPFTQGVAVTGGSLTVSGALGTVTGSALTLTNGTFIVDNTTAAGGNANGRLDSTGGVILQGGSFIYKGSDAASTNSTDATGTLTQGAQSSIVTISYGGTNLATVTAAAITHAAGNATTLVNGVGLGNSNVSSSGRLKFATAPTLVGTSPATNTGINAGVDNTVIVPFLTGEATATTGGLGTATGTANTFLTYNAATGLRPLNPTDEFMNNAIVVGDNTYITSATTASSTAAINSLVLSGGNLTVNSAVALTNTSGALLIVGTESINGPGTYTTGSGVEHEIVVDSGATGTISAAITANGSNALTKSGLGTLVLNGANTYTGATTIDTGILSAQSNTALGTNTAAATVVNGATLQLAGNISIGAKPLTISGTGATGATGALENVSGTNNYAGLVTLGAASTITSDSGTLNLTNAGTISGAFGLTLAGAGTGSITSIIGNTTGGIAKAGTGTWTLSGANTYTGATAVNLGTLALNGGSLAATAVTVGSAATPVTGVSGNATLQVNGNYTIGGAGAGTLVIKGGNTGGTPLGQGTLSMQDGTINTLTINNSTASATALTIGSTVAGNNSVLSFDVGATSDSIVLGSGLKTSVGTSTTANLVNVNGLGSLSGTTQTLINSPGGLAAGSFANFALNTTSGNFGGYALTLGSTTTSLTLVETANVLTTNAYWNGAASAVTAQGGTTAWNSFVNGNTNTSNFGTGPGGTGNATGTLNANTNVFFDSGVTGPVSTTLGQNFTINSLNLSSTNTVTIGGTNTLTILASNANSNTAGNGITVATGAASDTISSNVALGANQTWTVTDATNTLTASGNVSGGFALTKAGAGTLKLSGSNSYTGGNTVTGGTVQLGSSNALGSASGALAVGSGGTVDLNGNSATVGAVTLGTGGSTLADSGVVATLTTSGVTVNGTSNTINSGVTVTGSVTQSGSSALAVNGTIGSDAMASGATLSGTGSAGAVTLAGSNTLSSTGTLTTSSISVSGSGNAISVGKVGGNITINGGGTLTVNGIASGTVGVASGATLSGKGTVGALTLAGGGIINTQDSSIGTLNGSTLTLNSGGGNALLDLDLGSSSADVLAFTGAASMSNNFTVNINGLSGAGTGTYTIVTAGSGLVLGDFSAGTLGGSLASSGDTVSFQGSGSSIQLVISSVVASVNYYFTGADSGSFTDAGNYNTLASGGTVQSSALSSTSNVFLDATSPTPVNTPPTLNGSASINTLTFLTGGETLAGTGTLTVAASSGIGITDSVGNSATTETVAPAVVLGSNQSWVSTSNSTLNVTGNVSGAQSLALTGNGTYKLGGANTFSGLTVGTGSDTPTLFLTNGTNGSATGTTTLRVNAGATLAGNGTSSGTSYNVSGTSTSARANILVGLTSVADTTVGNTLTLIGSTGTSTIADANLTFNLSATSTASNQLAVSTTNIAFGTDAAGSVKFTLNLQGEPAIVPNGTLYTLIAGTGVTGTTPGSSTGQYTGLTLGTSTTVGGVTQTIITGNNLQLAFGGSTDQSYYGNGSYLVLYQSSGVDDIDVVVVPEPGTWALMLGGLAVLVVWQRRKNRQG